MENATTTVFPVSTACGHGLLGRQRIAKKGFMMKKVSTGGDQMQEILFCSVIFQGVGYAALMATFILLLVAITLGKEAVLTGPALVATLLALVLSTLGYAGRIYVYNRKRVEATEQGQRVELGHTC